MKRTIAVFAVLSIASAASCVDAQDQPVTQDPQQQPQQEEIQPPPAELQIPVDDSIKLTIDPVQVSSVVDRVNEPCTVTIKSPGLLNAQLYLIGTDAPYGGLLIGDPRLIGEDNHAGDKLSVRWSSKETNQYVKLFAIVHKKNAPDKAVRSRTLDVGIGPARFKLPPVPPRTPE